MHQDKKCTIIKNAIVQPTRALGIAALTHHRLQHQANLFYEDIKLNDIVIMTISANDAPFSVDLLRGREQIEMLLFLYKKEAKKAHQCKRGMDTFSLRFLLATEIRFVHKTKENPYLSDGMFQCLVILQVITQFLNQSKKKLNNEVPLRLHDRGGVETNEFRIDFYQIFRILNKSSIWKIWLHTIVGVESNFSNMYLLPF